MKHKKRLKVHWYRLHNIFFKVYCHFEDETLISVETIKGLFNLESDIFSSINVFDYRVDRSLIQRILGCCTISITLINEELDSVVLKDVQYKEQFVLLLREAKQTSQAKNRTVTYRQEQ